MSRSGAPSSGPAGGWRGRLVLLLVSLLVCLVVAEVGSRLILRQRFGMPIRDPGRILYAFYHGLEAVERDRPRHDDEFFDILVLGGSVLQSAWGSVPEALLEDLAFRGHRKVRLYNLAMEGHTSRDSRLKYEAMQAARFDLVIFYHGINEARANSVPPELFREDYSHFAWYETANHMAPRHGRARLALPLALRWLGLGLKQRLFAGRYAPPATPRSDWLQYGESLRSATAFEQNLRAVLDVAAGRGDPVLLMTFAAYVPAGYSRGEFKALRLGYGLHLFPLELWGRADNVTAAVTAHNEVVRRLAEGRDGVWLIDQAGLMAGTATFFNDPCHLTVSGSQRFVANLLPAVLAVHEAVCQGCP